MNEVIRNVEWIHADTKKLFLNICILLLKNGACKLLTVFEKENLEKQYFDEIKK